MREDDTHGDIAVHPVYIIVSQHSAGGGPWNIHQYGLPNIILDVIACDVTDIDWVFRERVYPLQQAGAQIETRIYSREPESFLKAWRGVAVPDQE